MYVLTLTEKAMFACEDEYFSVKKETQTTK